MKFNTLKIKNIASIEEATIDFQDAKFAKEPLFLIYGKTGSGKTTILDSICLALYKETPRMKQSLSEKYVDESLLVLKGGENEGIQVDDPRQYMRRGTREAFVELGFEGNDQKMYTARIEFGVSRTGNLQKTIWTLNCGTTSYDKDKNIRETILRVVGLDFDQFCRTTMLAQGEFTKFLKSSEKEKSSILEKITGTDIYSKIGAEIFAITKSKESDLKNETSKLGDIHLFDNETIAAHNAELLNLSKDNEIQTQQKANLTAHKTWLETAAKLQNDYNTIKSEHDQCEKIIESPKTHEVRSLITLWRNTVNERFSFRRLAQLKEENETLKTQETKLQQTFEALTEGDAWRKQEIDNKTAEKARIDAFLDSQAANADMYSESALIVAKLSQYIVDSRAAKANTDNVKNEETILKKRLAEKKSYDKQLVQAETVLQSKQTVAAEVQKALDAMQSAELQKQNNHLHRMLSNIQVALTTIEKSDESKKVWDEALLQCKHLENVIVDCSAKISAKESQLTSAKSEVEQAEKLLLKLKESVGDYAKSIRADLHEGDQCPVCGQQVHHLENDESFENALRPVQSQFEEKKAQCESLQTAYNQWVAEVKSNSNLLKDAQKNESEKNQSYKNAQESAAAACRTLDLDAVDADIKQKINDLSEQKKSDLQLIEKKMTEAAQLQNQVNALQQEKEVLSQNVSKAKDAVIQAQANIEKSRSEIKRFAELAQQKQLSADESKLFVATKITYSNWEQDIESTINQLNKDADIYSKNIQETQRIAQFLTSEKTSFEQSQTIRQRIAELFPKWKVGNNVRKIDRMDEYWNELSERCNVLKMQFEQNAQLQQECRKTLDNFLLDNTSCDINLLQELAVTEPSQIDEQEKEIKALDERWQKFKGALSQTEQRLQTHLAQKPQMEEDATIDSLAVQIGAIEATMVRHNQKIGEIKNLLNNNEQNKQLYASKQESIDRMATIWQKWDRLCKIFGSADGNKFRIIAQSYVLRELLVHANNYLRHLSKRYLLECQNDSLTILVRDMNFGGVRRPVDLVSGGESFVVSLALALGLSTLNNNHFSSDILFIDEGFGTLDANTLEVVMEMLSRLREIGGRRVGIISHVEQLQERIAAKISVVKVSANASRIVME